MTKKELMKQAQALNINGRSRMNKDVLRAAIAAHTPVTAQVQEDVVVLPDDAYVVALPTTVSDALTLVQELSYKLNRVVCEGQALKQEDAAHPSLTTLRTVYLHIRDEMHAVMMHTVKLYKPTCRKCGGKGYFPQYQHRDGGHCYSCSHPRIEMNVIFKDIDWKGIAKKPAQSPVTQQEVKQEYKKSTYIPLPGREVSSTVYTQDTSPQEVMNLIMSLG